MLHHRSPDLFPLLLACALLALAAPAQATDSGPSAPDGGTTTLCSSACQAKGKHLCIMDSVRKRCVECTKDSHCSANPAAFGPTCDTAFGICTCSPAKTGSCSGKAPGSRCLSTPFSPLCGCLTSSDCGAGLKCVGEAFGFRVCATPCKADKECAGNARPFCDTAGGACSACRDDKDCHGPYAPRCDTALGACVACLQDGHCTAADKTRCDRASGRCEECTGDTHCPGALGEGSQCVLSALGDRRCRCKADTDCQGNKFGPTCQTLTGRCSCTADTQCKAPLKTCTPTFIGSTRKQCTAACKDNSDCASGLRCLVNSGYICGECNKDSHCADPTRPRCDAKQFKCMGCKADADCKAKDASQCDTTTGMCVACKADADCKASPLGSVCSAGQCTCASDTDCKAAAVWGDRCVDSGGVKRCGCKAATDCQGSAKGDTCSLPPGKCGCKIESECQAGVTKCRLAYPGAKYKACLALCKTDSDCTHIETSRCDVKSGLCVACAADAHCAAKPWEKLCDTSRHRCVECTTDTHCTSSTLGNKCKGSICTCAVAADCKGNVHGAVCDAKYRTCGCIKDTDCATGKKCKKTVLGTKVKLCQ